MTVWVARAVLAVFLTLVFVAVAKAETRYQKAKRIVYAVFPDSTQAAALRVVGCETGYTYEPWARNRSSGAYGWFQFLPGNHGRLIRWGNSSMRINYYRMGNPWYATTAAMILSQGGTNWSEWSCRP